MKLTIERSRYSITEKRHCSKCGAEFTVEGFQIMGRKLVPSNDLCKKCEKVIQA